MLRVETKAEAKINKTETETSHSEQNKKMSKNSIQSARVFAVLNIQYTVEILCELTAQRQSFSYFRDKYGRGHVSHPLKQLLVCGLIRKILDKTKSALGYEITEHGRWVFNSFLHFQKSVGLHLQ